MSLEIFPWSIQSASNKNIPYEKSFMWARYQPLLWVLQWGPFNQPPLLFFETFGIMSCMQFHHVERGVGYQPLFGELDLAVQSCQRYWSSRAVYWSHPNSREHYPIDASSPIVNPSLQHIFLCIQIYVASLNNFKLSTFQLSWVFEGVLRRID